MFAFLRKWLERPKTDQAPSPPQQAVKNASDPAGQEPPEAAEKENLSEFVCREALLGRDQKIIGYEFSHPQHLQSRLMDKRIRVHQYYDDVLLRHLAQLNLDDFLGERLAFIGISPASLFHPALLRLPRQNIALSLNFTDTPVNADTPSTAKVIDTLKTLRANGIHIGLRWRQQAQDLSVFLPYADFVQMVWQGDMDQTHENLLEEQVAALRQPTANTEPLRLMISNLQTPEEFRLCYRLGFDFFRGSFINYREPGKVVKGAINRLRIMQLLNNVRQDAENNRLTQELKQDPVLSYRLLRYVNSPGMGLAYQISNLDQALTILGRNTLYRWLSFLLFNVADPGYYEWALTEQALARAALMERLGKKAGLDSAAQDALFLTGLFSLLDQLMGEPLSELTAKIQIPDEIRIALVRREGMPAQFLALAEACERTNPQEIAQCAKALGLCAQDVNLAVFEALTWAHEMTKISVA
jgi:EAL and modified HD-GYP domain-containing signal transduction protein